MNNDQINPTAPQSPQEPFATQPQAAVTPPQQPTQPMQPTPYVYDPPVSEQKKYNKRAFNLGSSRAYFAEYALVLLLTGFVLAIVGSMLGTILKYVGTTPENYLGVYAYTASVSTIASLFVALPALFIFSRRTRTLEEDVPTIKNRSWRKGMLGVFLVIAGLYAIGYSVAFMYSLVSFFASLGLGTGSAFPWRGLISHSITAAVFLFTTWLFAQDYRLQTSVKEQLAKLHRYGLSIIAIVLLIVFIAVPFRAQRGEFMDQVISDDLRSIQTKVSDYDYKEGKLPKNLDDIDLKDDIAKRAAKYEYKPNKRGTAYDLCAVFNTNTKDKDTKSGQNPLETAQNSAYGANYYYDAKAESQDVSIHDKGRVCFTEKVYGGSTSRNDYNGSEFDFGTDDEEATTEEN